MEWPPGRPSKVELADFNLGHEDPMTDDRMALIDALQKADDGNFLRNLTSTVLQILMEFEREAIDPVDRSQRE